ncbi:hypothetical protein DMB66_40895 [Actinoplanes sp. ATCC 53533]|nr:hypothetical protein DMB66_40895 [Actinoplanes sp. ATCC 53533]
MDTGQHSAATEQPSPPAAPRSPGRRRRTRLLVAGGVVAVLLVAGLVAARLAATGDGQSKPTDTGIASCARHIAEGVVSEVSPSGAGAGRQVTIQVEKSLKGAEVGKPLTYDVDEPSGAQVSPGTRVFVIVSRFPAEPVHQYVDADVAWARDWMTHTVPLSQDMPCDGPA